VARRDLKLNSIRYVKESSRLVLEEHGHCEVPAGCGGVVLRWRQRAQVPIEIWIYTLASLSAHLDGSPLRSGRPLVGPGDHVLAFRFSGVTPGEGVFMLAGVYDEKEFVHVRITPSSGRTARILSLPDGTWRYSTEDPIDDAWMKTGYDDSRWLSMIPKWFPQPAEDEGRAKDRIEKITQLGGQGLGIDQPADTLLVRRAFTLSLP